MSKHKKPNPIIDRFQLENDRDVDKHNAERNQQRRLNEHLARNRVDLADVARHKLSPEVIAKYSALGGSIDAETLAHVAAMERAERSAAATAENYLLASGGLVEALHHHMAFLQEPQKLALDVRKRLMTPFMVGRNGELPTGTTENGDGRNLLESVTVYATSRPASRWVLDDSMTFHDVVAQIEEDTHCDCSDEPFRKSLAAHVPSGFRADCIAQMAEDAAVQRKMNDYRESDLKSVAPQHRDNCKRPKPVTVGLLLPIAFSNEIVVLKLCHGHAFALAEKYGIQLRDCGIEEPWESVGNYW